MSQPNPIGPLIYLAWPLADYLQETFLFLCSKQGLTRYDLGPIASGTAHFERGSEFWTFGLISSVVNEETFSAWLNTPGATASSSST